MFLEGDNLFLRGLPDDDVEVEVVAMSGQRILHLFLSGENSITLSRANLPHHGIVRVLNAEGHLLFSRIY